MDRLRRLLPPHNKFLKSIPLALTLLSGLFFSLICTAKENSPADSKNIQSATNTRKSFKQGVTFSVRQILPDQVNAFYLGRGFSLDQIKSYANTCVYMSVLRNDSAEGKIHFLRNTWDIITPKKKQHPKANSEWLSELKALNVKPSSLIAFRFAQLPEEQEYQPGGDWNQGMLSTIALPDTGNKATFDITVRWDIKGKPYQLTLEDINCVNE